MNDPSSFGVGGDEESIAGSQPVAAEEMTTDIPAVEDEPIGHPTAIRSLDREFDVPVKVRVVGLRTINISGGLRHGRGEGVADIQPGNGILMQIRISYCGASFGDCAAGGSESLGARLTQGNSGLIGSGTTT